MKKIILLLFAGLIFRLILSPFGTLSLDQNTFIAWSNILVEGGFKNFYNGWSDYLPGYLYVLRILGGLGRLGIPVTILYKLPAIFSDLATGYLIYLIVKQIKNTKTAIFAASIYVFNPAIIANSTLWGQVDSLTALFGLLAVYLANINPVFSAVSLAIGTMIKPQAALASLVILFIWWRDKIQIKKIVIYLLIAGAVFALGFLPFTTINNLFAFIGERLTVTMTQYKYTSVNAFNFWGLWGFWLADQGEHLFGWVVTLGLSLMSALRLRKVKSGEYLLLTIVFLIGFLFLTRLHERHALPILAPLAVSISLFPSLIFGYVLLSFVYLTNLYYAYVWISENFKEIFTRAETIILILINILSLITIIFVTFFQRNFLSKLRLPSKVKAIKLPDLVTKNRALLVLSGILFFASLSRFLFLSLPKNEYFDEVYHAFTARTLFHNDPKAWEWWNPNPEGFAYEWTHPPLAKEAMVVGMSIIGENALGWRTPAALLGVICVLLIYLITKKLFDRRDIALLSAGVFALEGLPLVMSRIGMNDTYFLFGILMSFYLFLVNQNLFSSIFLGLAAASKWSTMWFLPILFVSHFLLKKKFRINYLWFVVIPTVIYLASYIPFFASGHTIEQFIELQKQMWWYHTRLVAEHGYSSPWWSWPILLRPIWLYVDRPAGDLVANIYAMGNPIIFWFGFASILMTAYYALIERSKKLFLIVFGYFVFFVPWALSPRIMFLYHFLPSVPFMAMASGVVLRRNTKFIIPVFVTAIIVFLYFYPHWTGIPVPQVLDDSYYWFPSWR